MNSGVNWDAAFDRQAARGEEVLGWCWRLLNLSPGDRVLDLGCGPGYPAGWFAERIAPGTVIAVDRDWGALSYLHGRQSNAQVTPVLGDIRCLPFRFADPIPTLATFVLHHVDRPVDAIAGIGRVLPGGSPVIIAEYRQGAAGDVGPPLDHRISSAAICRWLDRAGFDIERERSLPAEKFAILARRRAP